MADATRFPDGALPPTRAHADRATAAANEAHDATTPGQAHKAAAKAHEAAHDASRATRDATRHPAWWGATPDERAAEAHKHAHRADRAAMEATRHATARWPWPKATQMAEARDHAGAAHAHSLVGQWAT